MLSKQELRQKMKEARNSLSQEYMQHCEKTIFQTTLEFLSHQFSTQKPLVMGYSHFKNEVPTTLLKEYCLQNFNAYCLPVTGKAPHMDAYLIEDQTGLFPDSFGVPTPNPTLCSKAEPHKIDIIFLPGLAFDPSGNRLGFGKGYYDCFLESAPKAIKIALSYDFQVLDQVPASPWDKPLDYIITEKRFIHCRGFRETQ